MRKTKNNKLKAALFVQGVKFTIDGVYNHSDPQSRVLMEFKMECNGECVTDGRPFGKQMNVDGKRSTGRLLVLYSFDLMGNQTTSKIKYSSINIIK